jgi:hypothetical protein
MMGRLKRDQGQFFYSFRLDEAVPGDHPVRQIAAVLDLSWVHSELAPFYPNLGRPSIDPELMIRMLIIGYAFAIRSERALCRDLKPGQALKLEVADFRNKICQKLTKCNAAKRSPFDHYPLYLGKFRTRVVPAIAIPLTLGCPTASTALPLRFDSGR